MYHVNVARYTWTKRRSIESRCKEHRRHIHLEQPEKSVVVEHSMNTGNHIDFSSTIVLYRTLSYMDRLLKEAIGIQLNNKIFNRVQWPHVEQCLTSCDKHAIQSESRSDAASSYWLADCHEHRTWAKIYMTRTGSPSTSAP
jgi:hypothetical protein